MRWSKLCLPVDEGGLGIRDLRDIRSALILTNVGSWPRQILYGPLSCEKSTNALLRYPSREVLSSAWWSGEKCLE